MVAARALTFLVALALAACATAPADPAADLRIAPPYVLEGPDESDYANLSGQITGLPLDLARSAGAGYEASDFPLGFQFIHESGREVGVVVLLGMPAEVAALPGLLEPIATAAAAEANGRLAYETVQGVKVGLVDSPIASALAVFDGHLVFVQTGLPSVEPKDLMTAVITANEGGFAEAT